MIAVEHAEINEAIARSPKDPTNNRTLLGPGNTDRVIHLVQEDVPSTLQKIVDVVLLSSQICKIGYLPPFLKKLRTRTAI